MMIILILFLAWAAAVSFVLLMNKLHEKPVVATLEDLEAIAYRISTAKEHLEKNRLNCYDVDLCVEKLNDLVSQIESAIKARRDAE